MSGTFDDGAIAQTTHEEGEIRYVGSREHGDVLVTKHPEGGRFTPERSLNIVLAVLLDYTDNAALARQHYQTFTDEVVSRLKNGADGTWTITDADIEQVLPDDIALPA